jgi:hypothetical protein
MASTSVPLAQASGVEYSSGGVADTAVFAGRRPYEIKVV